MLLRDFHHVSEKYLEHLKGNELWMLPITDRIEVICHGDFAPYNVTFIDNRPLFDRIITRLKQLITFMTAQASKGDRQFQQDIMEGHLDIYEKDILFLMKMRDIERDLK